MALQDLTGIYRNKKFEGGVGGGASPVYGGPSPVDETENVSPETLKASVMGIYEKYGRSAKGMKMAKASPEYAALQGAGINVFGTPTSNNSGMDSNRKQTTNLENAPDEAKKKAAAQYAALEGGGSRGRVSRTPSTSLVDAVNGGAEVTPPAPTENKPRVPESTPQTAQSTSMSAINPPTTPAPEPTQTPTQETSKGPRLDTYRGPTEPRYDQAGADEATARQETANAAMSRTRDAGERMALAAERNNAQDAREGIKKQYNQDSELLARKQSANEKMFGNPNGPDGGKSFRQKEKPPELSPLGGYQENITSGARGGTIDFNETPRGGSDANALLRAGYNYKPETETVAVGPMTNKPASSQAEYNQRAKAFASAGENQKQDNADAMERKRQAARQNSVNELNKKYAGPGPSPRKS
jgi:hypothetical protein